jgi:hypothetical protein
MSSLGLALSGGSLEESDVSKKQVPTVQEEKK